MTQRNLGNALWRLGERAGRPAGAEQYRAMAFAQLAYRESLRDIEVCLSAQATKLYHMGLRAPVRRSTLADANETRDWRIYAQFAQQLIAQAWTLYADESLGLELTNTVYALDSTTIDLCLSGWAWHPGDGRKPAPGTQEQFGAIVQAWIDTGAECPRATILDPCAEPERAGRVSPEKPDDPMAAATQTDKTRQPSRGEFVFRDAVRTDIPARLDRLPWCRFHVLIVVALGVTWILDGLEVTIVGAIGPVLQDPKTLALSAQQIGAAATSYVVGAVCGALIFGWLTDRFGRRFVFYGTLIVYLAGVLLSATSWNFWSFAAFRAITGVGIGGEYAAINSAIDELIPAHYRGRVDLMVNGSFCEGFRMLRQEKSREGG